jgi:multimeric flavodoxin WrbA
MKVIVINGSPKANGNTAVILKIMCEELEQQGIDTKIVHVGDKLIHGCKACGYCSNPKNDGCVIKDDIVNETVREMSEADGIILGSPTYYANIPGTMKSFLDRVFYSSKGCFKYKVGTAITTVRRAGGDDVVRQMRNYFELAEMLVPPSQYWLAVYGRAPGEVLGDAEGIQSIRKNAQAMAWLLKVVDEGKKNFPLPQAEERIFTNFIR